MHDTAILRSTVVYAAKLALAIGVALVSALASILGIFAFSIGDVAYGLTIVVLLALPITIWLALKVYIGYRWVLVALVMTPWLLSWTETVGTALAATAIVHFTSWWFLLCADDLSWRFSLAKTAFPVISEK